MQQFKNIFLSVAIVAIGVSFFACKDMEIQEESSTESDTSARDALQDEPDKSRDDLEAAQQIAPGSLKNWVPCESAEHCFSGICETFCMPPELTDVDLVRPFVIDLYYPERNATVDWGIVTPEGYSLPLVGLIFSEKVAADGLTEKFSFNSESCGPAEIRGIRHNAGREQTLIIWADFKAACTYTATISDDITSLEGTRLGRIPEEWTFTFNAETTPPDVLYLHPLTQPKHGQLDVSLDLPTVDLVMTEPIDMSTVVEGTWSLWVLPGGEEDDEAKTNWILLSATIAPGPLHQGMPYAPTIRITPSAIPPSGDVTEPGTPWIPGQYALFLYKNGDAVWKDVNGSPMTVQSPLTWGGLAYEVTGEISFTTAGDLDDP